MCSVAYFISSHGYGHASRASAVMAAMHEKTPSIRFEIFTTVPERVFQQSLSGSFAYNSLMTDVGMVQKTPLREDLPETLRSLNNSLPYDHSLIEGLSGEVVRKGCRLIICDISPMGIAVAKAAHVPSVLIENFTWDWLYESYAGADFPAGKHIDYLRKIFDSADYHIQAEPVCNYKNADLTTVPISRKPSVSPRQIRHRLGIPEGVMMVMITMGGIPEEYMFLEQLTHQNRIYFIIPGGSKSVNVIDNLVLLPHHSDFFHPDLVNACDAVIGKLGYSTLAEIYHAGIPYGYITRSNFRESDILEAFVRKNMNGYGISEIQYRSGDWVHHLPEILDMPMIERNVINGASEAAQFIDKILNARKHVNRNQRIYPDNQYS